MKEFEFIESDDVNGDTRVEVWGEGSRIHIRVCDTEGNGKSVYIRNGAELAKMILASAWGYNV